LCRYGGRTGLENATCRRTLYPDGTVTEFVEILGSNEETGRVTDEQPDEWFESFPVEVAGRPGQAAR
jgi:hypothetical protein